MKHLLDKPSYLLSILAVSATLLSLQGCGPEFDPYWKANKLRILALRSDPVTLQPGQNATFEALISNPDNQTLTYQWEWCPFAVNPQTKYECPITREELIEIVNQSIEANAEAEGGMQLPEGFDIGALIPEFQLGNEPTATLSYPLTPEFVLGLCQGLQFFLSESDITGDAAVTSSCDEGFDVTMRFTMTPEGGEPVIGAKRFTLWTGSEFDKNQNPEVAGIDIRLKESADADKVSDRLPWVTESEALEDRWYRIPEDEPLPILANVTFEVRSAITPESVEIFQRPAPTGSDGERLPEEEEGFEIRWFVEVGELEDSRQIFGAETKPLDEVALTGWTINYIPEPTSDQKAALKDGQDEDWDLDGVNNDADNCPYVSNPGQEADGCIVPVSSVVSDSRLGVGWSTQRVNIIGHEPE